MYSSTTSPENQKDQFQGWAKHAERLSEWTLTTLVNRTDAYGSYTAKGQMCIKEPLTAQELIRHYRAQRRPIGLYTTSPVDDSCRFLALDIDAHDGRNEANWQVALGLWQRVRNLGMLAALEDSNGQGGFHVWIPFAKKIPAAIAQSFGKWLCAQADAKHVEVFPKQATVKGKFGNFLRLPGRHHRHLHYSRFFDSENWLEGAQAAQYLMAFTGNAADMIPALARDYKEAPRLMRLPARQPGYTGESDRHWLAGYLGDLKTLRLVDWFEDHNRLIDEPNQDVYEVVCPWAEEHTTGPGAFVFRNKGGYPGFFCHHAHCEGKGLRDLCELMGESTVDAYCQDAYCDRGTDNTQIIELLAHKAEDCQPERLPRPDEGNDQGDDYQHDPRTAYLWQGVHALDDNVTEAERLRRARSVLGVYDLIPPRGFLADFLASYLPTSDVSPLLLLGAALSTAAGLLGRRVRIINGGQEFYPSLWVALLASSGERKSFAVNAAARVVDQQGKDRLPSEASWAVLAAHLGIPVPKDDLGEPDWQLVRNECQQKPLTWERGSGCLCLDEIGGWLRVVDQPFNAGLKETLTGAYEALPEIKRSYLASGDTYIYKPCINILGASTPEWLASSTKDSDVRGGFLGRWLFFVSPGPDYKLPQCDPRDSEATNRLDESGHRLAIVHGQVSYSPGAWAEYRRWVKGLHLSARLASWSSRLSNGMLKVGAIYELCDTGKMVVSADNMIRTGRLLDRLLLDLDRFVEMELPIDRNDKTAKAMLKIVNRHPEGVMRTKAMKLSHLRRDEFNLVVDTLLEQGAIRATQDVGANGKHSTTYFPAGVDLTEG